VEIPGKPIAVGRTAEIFAWGEGRILKLLRPGFPSYLIQQEEVITAAICQAGIPVPKIYEVVEVDGRAGIIYERIDGPSLMGNMEGHLFGLWKYASLLARLHALIHTHTFSPAPEDAPRQKKILAQQIEAAEVLPAAVRSAVLALLDALPDGDTLCHNDFHPLNVLMGSGDGGVDHPVIIDWESASLGNPCADVARTTLTVALGRPAEGFPNLWVKKVSEWYLRAFTSAYLASYRSFSHNRLEDLRAWQTVQAVSKVQWEAPANQGMWVDVIYQGLEHINRGKGNTKLV
jgi:aminoglycoside phosphotransferase (APT) family kinase protein